MLPRSGAGLRGGSDSEVFNGVPIDLGGDLIVAFAGEPSTGPPTSPDRDRAAAPRADGLGHRCPPRHGKRENVRLRLSERPSTPPADGLAGMIQKRPPAGELDTLRQFSLGDPQADNNERVSNAAVWPIDGDRTVRLTIPAKPEYITLSRLALTGLSRVRPFSDETLADLKLALTEACSNSVRHAYADGDGATSTFASSSRTID